MDELYWKLKKPTVAGWYWYWDVSMRRWPRMTHISPIDGVLRFDGHAEYRLDTLPDDAYFWYGPIEVPKPPISFAD